MKQNNNIVDHKNNSEIKLISFFSGIGGLDLGFEKAGFKIIWANDNDKDVRETFEHNFPHVTMETRDITHIKSTEIPEADGFIGGPPCGAWSAAGANKGLMDKRGRVFLEYLRIINDKAPKFFLIENVEGITRKTHRHTLNRIIEYLQKCGQGYNVFYKLLNASDYEVPQDRKRVFFVGFREDLEIDHFDFPDEITSNNPKLEIIRDLEDMAQPSDSKINKNNGMSDPSEIQHMYLNTGWSSQFMSRNRVRTWNQKAFTVPASGRHVTIHPSAPKMKKKSKDLFEFEPGYENKYRRFTVRECARLQTFPDSYELKIRHVNQGYKLVGNAVPVNLAYHLAIAVRNVLEGLNL